MQRIQPAIAARGLSHAARERIVQPRQDLKQREIRIGKSRPQQVAMVLGIVRKDSLEIAEELGDAVLEKIRGPAARLFLLILIIKRYAHRMMRVVSLSDKIRHRQLQFMRPQPAALGLRRKSVARTQKLQNIGGLAYQQPAGL